MVVGIFNSIFNLFNGILNKNMFSECQQLTEMFFFPQTDEFRLPILKSKKIFSLETISCRDYLKFLVFLISDKILIVRRNYVDAY